MDRDERRGTGRIDRQTWALQAEDVRQAARRRAQRAAGAEVEILCFQFARLEQGVLAAADAHEHARLSAQQSIGCEAGSLERLPAHLEKQPLLRIEADGFARRNAKELRVERVHALQERAATRVHLPGRVWIGIVVVGNVPAIGGNVGCCVEPLAQPTPERIRARGSARKPAANADDGNRFGGDVDGALAANADCRLERDVLTGVKLCDQSCGQRLERRTIEGQRRGQRLSGCVLQPVPQFDGHERIEADVSKALVRFELKSRIETKHLEGLRAHVIEDDARTICGSHRLEQIDERPATCDRRWPGDSAGSKLVEQDWHAAGGEPVEEHRPVDGQYGDLCRRTSDHIFKCRDPSERVDRRHTALSPAILPMAIHSGRHSGLSPRTPVDRHGRKVPGSPVVRERIEERVSRSVVRLAWIADDRCRRREHHEEVERLPLCVSVQVPGARHFRRQHRLETRPRLLHHHPIVERAGRVNDAADRRHRGRDAGNEVRDVGLDGHVGAEDTNGGAAGSEPRNPIARSLGGTAPSDERQVTSASCDERTRDRQSEGAVSAGHYVGAIGADFCRHDVGGDFGPACEARAIAIAGAQRELVIASCPRDQIPDSAGIHGLARIEIDANASDLRQLRGERTAEAPYRSRIGIDRRVVARHGLRPSGDHGQCAAGNSFPRNELRQREHVGTRVAGCERHDPAHGLTVFLHGPAIDPGEVVARSRDDGARAISFDMLDERGFVPVGAHQPEPPRPGGRHVRLVLERDALPRDLVKLRRGIEAIELGGLAIGESHPVALALEGIRGQRGFRTAIWSVEGDPVDRHSGHPQPRE